MFRSKQLPGILAVVVVSSLLLAPIFAPGSAVAQETQTGGPVVGYDYNHDISAPLSDLQPVVQKGQTGEPQAKPLLTLPNALNNQRTVRDRVVQDTPGTPNMPSPILNFEGIDFPGVNCNCAPPDTNGEVGLSQYVQIVNQGFQVFDKSTGSSILGPLDIATLWSGFGGVCEGGFGDPVVLYDQLANRWVVTQFAGTGIPTDECIAVSTTSDATGSYNRYGFHLGEDFFDYPKLGVWPDAYYMGMNVFNSSGTAFLGPQPFAFDRAAMLAGTPATFVTFRDPAFFNPSSDQFMPADLDGLIPPPAGAPNPFLSTGTNATWPLHRFHVDFSNPGLSTFTLDATLTPSPFSVLFQNIPQLGTGDTLDSLADRGMFRSAYRNFGDHEALVGNMTVASGGVAGVRWFEVNNATSGAPSFVQESTYQPDSTWRWMGSAAMDGNGNLAVGFSASDATIHPQIRYAGRLAGDPANTLAQGEAHLFDGTGSQLDTVSRWGDYSDLTVDPVDDCTFWYTQEYYDTNSSFNWRTRIGNFTFPSCTAAPHGTLQGTVTDASTSSPIAGAQINVAPLGASTVTDGSGNYSLTLPVGTYDVSASAFGYVSQTTNSVDVTDGGTATADFALQPAPSHTVSGNVSDTASNPIENATVTILGAPIPPATTDATGFYSFGPVPDGEYDVNATAGGCNDPLTQHLSLNGADVLDFDFALPARSDNFGYFCQIVTPGYIEGTTPLGLTGDDDVVQVGLPFAFSFYGQTYSTSFVATNGFLNFLSPNATFGNSAIPSTFEPNGAIYPYWDDLFLDGSSSTFTDELQSPHRFLVEWRNARYFGDTTRRVDFEVILYETGQILTQYRNIDADGREQGNSATIGIENEAGTDALQYSFNEASIASPDFAVLYSLPPSGFIQGNVTDANDNLPIAGASVKALQGGNPVRSVNTDANGFYRVQVPVGAYDVEASSPNYTTETASVDVAEDETVQQDFVLDTARAEVSPGSFEFIVPAGQQRTQILGLSNTGGVTLTWEMRETGGGAVEHTSMQGLAPNPEHDPNATTTEGLYEEPAPKGWDPTAPGDVLTSWVPAGFDLPWGVGFNGNVWLSDVLAGGDLCAFLSTCHNAEFTVAGAPTGRDQPADWAGVWNADMALDTTHNAMCQVNVGGDNGIYCWDLNDGHVVGSITSGPWTGISQRGLAYRPDDNSFYIGGWNEGILYHVQGLGSPSPGAVLGQCSPPDPNISGLAWNAAFNIVWAATNSPTDTIYELNPATCDVLSTLPHPTGNFSGAGLEMDDAGNLWTVSQANNTVYLIESGVPAFVDVPWLSEVPSSGSLAPGGTQQVQIKVNTAGMAPGVYSASIFVVSNSGRQPSIRIPVSLIVPAYYQGVNAGGGVYTDLGGNIWAADKAFAAGSWGYVGMSSTLSTKKPIAGTLDDRLYQDLRTKMLEYRFDGLPNGVYMVDLRFAELANTRPGRHLFDVIIEGMTVLPAFDIASEVGSLRADDKIFFVLVTDGQLNIRFIPRTGFGQPIINALRVVHRPDR
jgi:malectin (di-glucose binding ER protein)/carboxypeptidase family protein